MKHIDFQKKISKSLDPIAYGQNLVRSFFYSRWIFKGTYTRQHLTLQHIQYTVKKFNLFYSGLIPAPPEVEEELETAPPEAAAAAAAQPLEPQAVEVEVEACWPAVAG